MKPKKHLILCIGFALCFLPFMNSAFALLLGVVVAVVFQRSYDFSRFNNLLLKLSIIFLGFGLSWKEVLSVSQSGALLTGFTVAFTIISGLMIGKAMRFNFKTTLLIAIGTAICGGSAIAAASPIIRPKNDQFTTALLVVFFLNALSLLAFPSIGRYLNLDQIVFGKWVAISIHDTSSVVGAAAIYGNEALEVATVMKLTRALWIVPVVVCLSIMDSHKQSLNLKKLPWFILLFVAAILLSNSLPHLSSAFNFLSLLGTKSLMVVLFFIGTTFNHERMRKIGTKGLLVGVALWIIVSVVSLLLLT